MDPDELIDRLDRIDYEVVRARRAAETTRTIVIVFALFFLVVPLVVMLFNMVLVSS